MAAPTAAGGTGESEGEARVAHKATTLAAPLATVRDEASTLYPEGGREIRAFTLSISSNMGLKRDNGRGSFVESVVKATEMFYEDVLQKLRTWKPAPPKLKKSAEREVPPETPVAELVGVEPSDIAELPPEVVEVAPVTQTSVKSSSPSRDGEDLPGG